MTLPSYSQDATLRIYLALALYPILSTEIRARMRRELTNRGIITPQSFEAEVRDKAILSQALEGLNHPFVEEPSDVWETRLARIRDHVTDFYFAYNLPFELLEQIIHQVLEERGTPVKETLVTFNPELAPQRYLFEQGFHLEQIPPDDRGIAEARLQEIKVVLIRTLISDQLSYVNIAKDWFTISDLNEIKKRKIGKGKIGGKSAGMLLASRILNEMGDDELRKSFCIPASYFIGADIMYDFMAYNGLMHWLDQKYKPEEQIRQEFPILQTEFQMGVIPSESVEQLKQMLSEIGKAPIIVRSSSLLEDNFGTSFAGKYESLFCPNQGEDWENLEALLHAVKNIYASIFNPDALLYRRAKGLQNYDERMALLIQVVQGEQFGEYYFPAAAGVAYSRNIYRWSSKIRRDDGFMRLVWGLGTRAVDRTGNDYARLVALSHPTLQPLADTRSIRYYAQQYIDLINTKDNIFTTLPVMQVLNKKYPVTRYLVEIDEGGYLVPLRGSLTQERLGNSILTFNELFRQFPLASRMTSLLQILEEHYHAPVDTEFTLHFEPSPDQKPEIKICILQCRPQLHMKQSETQIPHNLLDEDILFATPRMVPQGHISDIRKVIFVSPEGYYALPTPNERSRLGRLIGELNKVFEKESFICIGPGRWGTSNPELGIHIGYGDIYNTRALIEVTGSKIGPMPEASYGTHFFQDLVELGIFPLAIYLDDKEAVFNREFFYQTDNQLLQYLPDAVDMVACLRVIDVASFRSHHRMELIMDNERGLAVAFLART